MIASGLSFGLILFFVVSALVMVLFNFTIPRMIGSVSSKYNHVSRFSTINYQTAMTLTLLAGFVTGKGIISLFFDNLSDRIFYNQSLSIVPDIIL